MIDFPNPQPADEQPEQPKDQAKQKRSRRPKSTHTGRGPGRPKRGEKTKTLGNLLKFSRLYLRGVPASDLCRKFKIDTSTANNWIHTCREQFWMPVAIMDVELEVAKSYELERFAWERLQESTQRATSEQVKYAAESAGMEMKQVQKVVAKTQRTGESTWAAVIEWCIEFRMRVGGGFAPQKVQITDVRVAGKSREQMCQEFSERINAVSKN